MDRQTDVPPLRCQFTANRQKTSQNRRKEEGVPEVQGAGRVAGGTLRSGLIAPSMSHQRRMTFSDGVSASM